MNIIDHETREQLYDIYVNMLHEHNVLCNIMRHVGGNEYKRAKAYWLAEIEVGIRCTFRSFLQDAGIIDEDEGFIVEEEEEED